MARLLVLIPSQTGLCFRGRFKENYYGRSRLNPFSNRALFQRFFDKVGELAVES